MGNYVRSYQRERTLRKKKKTTTFISLQVYQLQEDLSSRNFPDSTTFVNWKMNFKSEVCSSSSFPTEAMVWIIEVDSSRTVDLLE